MRPGNLAVRWLRLSWRLKSSEKERKEDAWGFEELWDNVAIRFSSIIDHHFYQIFCDKIAVSCFGSYGEPYGKWMTRFIIDWPLVLRHYKNLLRYEVPTYRSGRWHTRFMNQSNPKSRSVFCSFSVDFEQKDTRDINNQLSYMFKRENEDHRVQWCRGKRDCWLTKSIEIKRSRISMLFRNVLMVMTV